VSARDSGKTPLEAVLGEIVVTAEKLSWLIKEGEGALKPSQRGAGVMVSTSCISKVGHGIEIIPVGVLLPSALSQVGPLTISDPISSFIRVAHQGGAGSTQAQPAQRWHHGVIYFESDPAGVSSPPALLSHVGPVTISDGMILNEGQAAQQPCQHGAGVLVSSIQHATITKCVFVTSQITLSSSQWMFWCLLHCCNSNCWNGSMWVRSPSEMV
jgi:hypothetical protein